MNAYWGPIAGLAVALVSGSSVVSADPGASRQSLRPHMSCSEFLRLEDQAKPEIVYYLATRDERRNGRRPVLDVDATDGMVPAIVERCKVAPTTSLSLQVNAETRRLERKL